jgi:hypothetical protein
MIQRVTKGANVVDSPVEQPSRKRVCSSTVPASRTLGVSLFDNLNPSTIFGEEHDDAVDGVI